MKAADTKTTAKSTSKHHPFFNKSGEGNFFSKRSGNAPYFGKQPSGPPIQTKLTVNEPGDPYEQEADAMSEKVVQQMSSGSDAPVDSKPVGAAITPLVQTKCDDCEQEEKQEEDESSANAAVQRKAIFESNEEEPANLLHRKENGSDSTTPTPSVESRLNSSKTGGEPLSPQVNQHMSNAFGSDFSQVRIHTGAPAAQLSDDLNAHAFTQGKDIYFNAGKYDTGSNEGKKLLAHELTHTMQQGDTVRRDSKKKPDKTLPEFKDASAEELKAKQVSEEGKKGFFTKQGSKIEIHMIDFKGKEYLNKEAESLFKGPIKLPGPNEERKTKQMSLWKSAVREGIDKQMNKLYKLGDNEKDTLSLNLVKEKTTGVVGTLKQLTEETLVPFWSYKGKPKLFDVEHMIDWQIVGDKADKIENLILLDRAYNRKLGNVMRTNIRNHIKGIAEAYSKFFSGLNADPDNVLANYDAFVENFNFGDHKIDEELLYKTKELTEEKADAGKTNPFNDKNVKVADERIPDNHFVLKTTDARAGYILPYNAKKHKLGAWEVTTEYDAKSKELKSIIFDLIVVDKGGVLAKGEDKGSNEGRTIKSEGGEIKSNKVAFEKFKEHVYQVQGRSLRQQFGLAFKDLHVAAMSPIQIDESKINTDGFDASVTGKIDPTLSFLKGVDINFSFANGEFYIQADIPLAIITDKIPKPFEVTSSSLILAASSRDGLTLAGNLQFKLGNFGKGELTAGANTDVGLFLNGKFDFNSKWFNPASIEFAYKKGKWSIKGTIGVEEGKITGVKSATLTVGYENEKFTASGLAFLTIPGIDKVTLLAEFDLNGNFSFSAEVELGKLPGIKSGKVKVGIKSKPGEEGISVSAAGKAAPDFPAIPELNTEFAVLYEDGIFDVRATVSYKKGRFTGKAEIGATNKAVNEKGEPQGQAPQEGPVVVFGYGELTVDLWKENKGTVKVRITPERNVLVAGVILIQNIRPFGDGYHINKELIPFPEIKIPLVGLPGLSISAFINGGVYFKFDWDPLVLKELRVELKEINVNEIENANLDIHGSIGSMANAELYMVIRAGLEAQALIAKLKGSIGGEAGLGIKAEAGGELDATFNKDKGLQFKEIRAFMNVTPRAIFRLTGEVSVDLDLWFTSINLYYHKWIFAEKELDLNGLALKLDFPIKFGENNEMIPPELEKINMQKPEFTGAKGKEILDDAINGDSKKELEEKKRKIREDVEYDLRKGQPDPNFTIAAYVEKMKDKYEDNEGLREFVLKTIDEVARKLEYEQFDQRKSEIRSSTLPLETKLSFVRMYTMFRAYVTDEDVEAFKQQLVKEDEDRRLAQQASQQPDPALKDAAGGAATPVPASVPPPDNSSSNIQKKELGNGKNDSSSKKNTDTLEAQLSQSQQGGEALDQHTKDDMGAAMGSDFSRVKVHTGEEADNMNRDLGAQAFTHGSDIYFAEGKYNPRSAEGKGLLAHELTHTVQQSGESHSTIQRDPDPKAIKTEPTVLPGIEKTAKDIYFFLAMPNPSSHREEIFRALLLQKGNQAALRNKYTELYNKDLDKELVNALDKKDGVRAKRYLEYGELRLMDKIYLASVGAMTDEDTLYRLLPLASRTRAKVEDDFANQPDYKADYPKTTVTLPDKAVSLVAGLLEDELSGTDLDRARALYTYGKLRPVDEIRIALEDREVEALINGLKNGMMANADKNVAFGMLEADYLAAYDKELMVRITMSLQTGMLSPKEHAKILQIIGKGSALERIRTAVEGPGTDEETIYDAIQTANDAEMEQLRTQFNDKESELYKLLNGDLNDDEMERVAALLAKNPTAKQQLAQVGATDGDDIFKELKMSSGDKFLNYRDAYNNKDGDFEGYISGKMNAEQKAETITIINGTPEQKLDMAIGAWTDDEDYVFHVLKNFVVNDPAKKSIKENERLMKKMQDALSTSDYNKVLDLLRLTDAGIEERISDTGAKIKRERSMIGDMSHAGDAMDDEYRELLAALDRAKADGELSPEEQKELGEKQEETNKSIEVYTKVRDELEETAATVLTTVTAVLVAIGTGGLASGLSAAMIAQQLAQAALVSALTRVAAMKVAKGDRFDVFGADGATSFAAGSVDGIFNVFGGAFAAKIVDAALEKVAVQAAKEAGEKAFQSVGKKILTDAVEGGLSAGVGTLVETSSKEETWKNGFVNGVEEAVSKAAQSAAIGTGMAAGISAGGVIINKLRGKGVDGAGGEPHLSDEAELKRIKGEVENKQLENSVKSSGRKRGPELTQAEIQAELNWAAGHAEVKPSSMAGYTHEVDLENGHFLRRKENGTWCRFSDAELCGIPGGALNGKINGAAAKGMEVKPRGKASNKAWDDPSLTLDEMIADYMAVNKSTKLDRKTFKQYYDANFRVNPETGRFNLVTVPIKGTPRASLPAPGTKAHQQWQDFLAGKNPRPCFPGSTMVKTPEGDKPIKEIKENDIVFTRDFMEDQVVMRRVVALMENWTEALIEIRFAGETIAATANHAFWVVNENKYYRADELQKGWMVRSIDGEIYPINAIRRLPTQIVTYNFEVEDFHNYFVGDMGILVHNDDVDIANGSKFADTTAYVSQIYVLKDPRTGKVVYVGQTIQDLESRFKQHLTDPDSAIFQYLKKKFPKTVTGPESLIGKSMDEFFIVSHPYPSGTSLTNFELSVWEQYYINQAGGKEALQNKINAITPDKMQLYKDLHNPCG